MIKQIIYGLLGMAVGLLLTVKAHSVVDNTGRIQWAETHLGGGGTYNFIRIIGIVVVVFFFLYMFGLVGIVYLRIVNFIYSILGMTG